MLVKFGQERVVYWSDLRHIRRPPVFDVTGRH